MARIAPWLLVLLSVLAGALRWLRMGRFWGDHARWIFEAWRLAEGEVPYRDFAWQYPPLSLWLFGATFEVFGATFTTAQVALDALGLAIILLVWEVARRVAPPLVALAVAVCTLALGATSGSDFALFSLLIYTPALLTGLIGILVLVVGALDWLDRGAPSGRDLALLGVGGTISLLSKPEFAVGALGALLLLLGLEGARGRAALPHATLRARVLAPILAIAPAILVLAAVAASVGRSRLMAAIGGYGIASQTWPWWPTGVALVGALAALGQGAALVAVLAAAHAFAARAFTRAHAAALMAGVVGAVIALAYVPHTSANMPPAASGGLLRQAGAYFLSVRGALQPATWGAVVALCVGIVVVVRLTRRGHAPGRLLAAHTLVHGTTAALSLRGLFGSTMTNTTTTSVAATPLLLVSLALLLVAALRRLDRAVGGRPAATRLAAAALFALAAIRAVGGAALSTRSPKERLDTAAGPVFLSDGGISAAVYHQVARGTRRDDHVLDLAYGGAVNFAARRASPIFSTQLAYLRPSDETLRDDHARLARRGARLVILPDAPRFGVHDGLDPRIGCAFPNLVWEYRPDGRYRARAYPVVGYVLDTYEPAWSAGDRILYRPHGTAEDVLMP